MIFVDGDPTRPRGGRQERLLLVEVATRTLDTHVAEPRRKLEGSGTPRHILTVRKIGYRLADLVR